MNRLLISFSGGRTSAYMTKRLLAERQPSDEIAVVFANTGDEDEQTLEFVDRCDREWGLGVVWVEAVVDPEPGKGTTHRIVTFATASRKQEPFRDVIAKYGIPNKDYNHCNRELKLRPIHSYVRSLGWERGSYDTAIGIRYDEADRMSADAPRERFAYPLVKWRVTKPEILAWFGAQPFDLDLSEERGNCVTCHKKSLRKLLTLARDLPEAFAWRAEQEALHPFTGAGEGPRRFYRAGWTTLDLMARARLPFAPFVDTAKARLAEPLDDLDVANGCSESCDVFADRPIGSSDLFSGLEEAA